MVPTDNSPLSLRGQGGAGTGPSLGDLAEAGALEALSTSFEYVFKIMPLPDFIFHLLIKNILCHHHIRKN